MPKPKTNAKIRYQSYNIKELGANILKVCNNEVLFCISCKRQISKQKKPAVKF